MFCKLVFQNLMPAHPCSAHVWLLVGPRPTADLVPRPQLGLSQQSGAFAVESPLYPIPIMCAELICFHEAPS